MSLMIVKKDGRREEFARGKLRAGVTTACAKRPVSAAAIEELVNEVETELRQREAGEINHALVGELVMNKLHALDHVAYIRFASVYRAFADLSSFEEEIRRAKRSTRGAGEEEIRRAKRSTRREGEEEIRSAKRSTRRSGRTPTAGRVRDGIEPAESAAPGSAPVRG